MSEICPRCRDGNLTTSLETNFGVCYSCIKEAVNRDGTKIKPLQAKLDIAKRDLTSIANCEGGKWAELAKETLKEIRKE